MNSFVHYDRNTGEIKGFYCKELHGTTIPVGSIEISEEVWQLLLQDQNKYKVDIEKALVCTILIDNLANLFVHNNCTHIDT